MLIPRRKVPDLAVETLDHGRFDLASETSARGTVICFYRGLHCPLCAKYLVEFEKLAPEFASRAARRSHASTRPGSGPAICRWLSGSASPSLPSSSTRESALSPNRRQSPPSLRIDERSLRYGSARAPGPGSSPGARWCRRMAWWGSSSARMANHRSR